LLISLTLHFKSQSSFFEMPGTKEAIVESCSQMRRYPAYFPQEMHLERVQPERVHHPANAPETIFVRASTFWNTKDRSTYHFDYPELSIDDYNDICDYAQLKGQKFEPGESIFEDTMRRFRCPRSLRYVASKGCCTIEARIEAGMVVKNDWIDTVRIIPHERFHDIQVIVVARLNA
jgi:hypothetical protein